MGSEMCIRDSFIASFVSSFNVNADVTCTGKITKVHKWHYTPRLSIMMEGATNWIQMPTETDDAMALTAFASGKNIELRWVASDVNSCTNGWDHSRPLVGFWTVLKD